jgi:hypothetical protein
MLRSQAVVPAQRPPSAQTLGKDRSRRIQRSVPAAVRTATQHSYRKPSANNLFNSYFFLSFFAFRLLSFFVFWLCEKDHQKLQGAL